MARDKDMVDPDPPKPIIDPKPPEVPIKPPDLEGAALDDSTSLTVSRDQYGPRGTNTLAIEAEKKRAEDEAAAKPDEET